MASDDMVRLATWISADVDERLRLQALQQRQKLSRLLTALLDNALPTADELTTQMREARS
jgi:hypothetical protein